MEQWADDDDAGEEIEVEGDIEGGDVEAMSRGDSVFGVGSPNPTLLYILRDRRSHRPFLVLPTYNLVALGRSRAQSVTNKSHVLTSDRGSKLPSCRSNSYRVAANESHFVTRLQFVEPVVLVQLQPIHINILEHPHLGSNQRSPPQTATPRGRTTYINHDQLRIIRMRVHEQRRPARRTKLVRALLLPEEVLLHVVFAAAEHHVCALGIDVEVAVLAADRTVAVGHFQRFQRGHVDGVPDGSAVAVGFVPDVDGGLGARHGVGVGYTAFERCDGSTRCAVRRGRLVL